MRAEDFLQESARRAPGNTALVAGRRRFTYAELAMASDRLAAALLDRGIVRGERVVVFMENSFEAIVAIIAVLKAGAVFCPVGPSANAERLAFVLNDSRGTAIITQARLASTAGAALTHADTVKLVVLAGGGAPPSAAGCLSLEAAITTTGIAPTMPGGAHDPAMIIYSGTPGLTGGLVLTHLDVVAAVGAVPPIAGNGDSELTHVELPLSIEDGLYQVLSAMRIGAAIVVAASRRSDGCQGRRQTSLDEEQADGGFDAAGNRAETRLGQRIAAGRPARASGQIWGG